MMAAKSQTITRVRVAREELDKMTKEQLQKIWNLQDQYIDLLENKLHSNSEHTELLSLRESEEKLKQQQLESSRRENILVMRLTTKEHEMQEFAGQIQELKQAQVPSIAQLRSALLDPAVNLLFERMRKEVDTLKARLEETQNELNAWKFTPDSNTGKRLMAKCRLLYQENEELGKIISSGRMAKLEGDLALQKSFSEEMKKSQSELDEFLLELDEDVEGMQSTIYYLQQQLREAKEQITQLQKEKSEQTVTSNGPSLNHVTNSGAMDVECRSPQVRVIVENSQVTSVTKDPVAGEVNRTDSSSPNDLNCKDHAPKTPPENHSDAKTEARVVVPDHTSKPAHNSTSDSPIKSEVPIKTEVIHSVVVENKNSINHDGPAKRTNPSDGLPEGSRTTNHAPDEMVKAIIKKEIVTPESSPQKTTNKRTPAESTRGRKRTRPRTPVEQDIKEESLPVRKRTRRREAEAARIDAIEENRTSVEIDTDTEVQVAQTLASWAATKQERTDLKVVEESPLGNGEIKKEPADK